MSDPKKSPFVLPHLQEIFDKLRRGRHLCSEDGVLYHALKDNFPAFADLFTNLGFRLETHPREFFFFYGEGSLSETGSRMGVFVFILMEYLTSLGEPLEETMMTKSFLISDLPHLKSERYRTYMTEAGIENEDGLINIVNNLEYYGFVRRRGESFSFRPPIYRFFDVCLKLGTPEDKKQ